METFLQLYLIMYSHFSNFVNIPFHRIRGFNHFIRLSFCYFFNIKSCFLYLSLSPIYHVHRFWWLPFHFTNINCNGLFVLLLKICFLFRTYPLLTSISASTRKSYVSISYFITLIEQIHDCLWILYEEISCMQISYSNSMWCILILSHFYLFLCLNFPFLLYTDIILLRMPALDLHKSTSFQLSFIDCSDIRYWYIIHSYDYIYFVIYGLEIYNSPL